MRGGSRLYIILSLEYHLLGGGRGTKLKIMFSLYGLGGNTYGGGWEGSQWMFANVGFGHIVFSDLLQRNSTTVNSGCQKARIDSR